MTARGDQLSHFKVTTVDGNLFEYSSVWQRRNLVLVTLAGTSAQRDGDYIGRLAARQPDFERFNARCIVTRDPVADVPSPAVIVADRWGEIVYSAQAAHVGELAPVDELLEWVEYIEQRCPECEGEAK